MDKKHFSSLKESTEHGNTLLPFQYYHCSIPETFTDLMLHWHDEAEIAVIRDGSALYQIGGLTQAVEKGDLVLISPNTLHAIHETDRHFMVSDSLVFHFDLLSGRNMDYITLRFLLPLCTGAHLMDGVISPPHPAYGVLRDCMEELFVCTQQKEYCFELHVKECLFRLFRLLYENSLVQKNGTAISSADDDKLKKAITFIRENYAGRITVASLAQLCGFSETHFMHFFRRTTGSTCIDYVNQYRLSVAASLLKSTDNSVMNIALDTGFQNVSYFNRCFKDRYGVTPGFYRKNQTPVT